MVEKRKLKIYGTRRRGHRERWYIKKEQKGRYREVRRDSKGRFISTKKWSPKKPIGKEVYTELQPLIIEYKTGKEAKEKVVKEVREWEWKDFEAESPWICPICGTLNYKEICKKCGYGK